eukprot:3468373-Amphidinium_carterae.1
MERSLHIAPWEGLWAMKLQQRIHRNHLAMSRSVPVSTLGFKPYSPNNNYYSNNSKNHKDCNCND